jgi:carboxymethylenebutenolidase
MRIVLRILGIILALLGIGMLGLVGSVFVDGALDGRRLDGITNQTIGDLRAFVARPSGVTGKQPAVIMVHEFWGLKPEITDKAKLLSEQGYVVIAVDTYRNQRTDWIPRAIYLSATTPKERVNTDLDAVFNWLETQPEVDPKRIAVMGFCYGGTVSLNYSLHNARVAATGIFYGQLITSPDTLKNLPGPVLGIFGGNDNLIPLQEVRDFEAGLKAANIPNEITVYADEGHAFVQGLEGIKAGGNQGKAWDQLLGFLQRSLKEKTPSGSRVRLLKPVPVSAYANPTPGSLLEVVRSHMQTGHKH